MEKSIVKMLADQCGHKAGVTLELDTETATAWVEKGYCEIVEIDETLNQMVEEKVEKISKGLKTVAKTPATATDHNDKSFSDYLKWVGLMASKSSRVQETAYNILVNKYNSQYEKTSYPQVEGTTTAGGFLVPTEYVNLLLKQDGYESAAFPTRTRNIPMSSNHLFMPVLDQTITPAAGQSAFYGGVSVGIISENTIPTDSTRSLFKQLEFTAKKVMAYTEVSSELLQDSPISLESIVSENFRGAIQSFVDYGVFNGNGTTNVTGLIEHAATISVNRKTINTVSLEDFANMWSRLAPSSRTNAAWFINPLVLSKLPLLGTSQFMCWLWPNGAAANPVLSVFGLPIIPTEVLPGIGSAGSVVLADLRQYVVAINKAITIDASIHYAFTSDKIVYRVISRLDGKPMLTAPITLMDGTSTVSPYIQLDSTVAS
jgi:HK97 family phage major capsid protein